MSRDSRKVTLFMFIYGHIKDQCKNLNFHDPVTSSFINQLRTLRRRVLSMFIFNCMQIGSPFYSNSVYCIFNENLWQVNSYSVDKSSVPGYFSKVNQCWK